MTRFGPLRSTLALLALASATASVPLHSADKEEKEAAPANEKKADGPARAAMFGITPARNMVNLTEKNVPTTWDVKTKVNIKWEAKLGSRAYGGPIVAGGRLFVGTNNEARRNPAVAGDKGVLMCFQAADGKFLWQDIHDKLAAGRVNDWPREGICSTPTIEGDFVFYVSNRGEVICSLAERPAGGKNDVLIEEKTKGKPPNIVWRYNMIKNLNVFPHNMSAGCPLIVGDLLYVVTGNGVDAGHLRLPSPQAPSFIALNKKTGDLVWRDNSPGANVMHGQWSNPVYYASKTRPQVIFPGGDGWLYSFEPTKGELLWKFDCNPKDSKYDLGGKGTRSDFIGTPVIYEDHLYIGVGQDPEHNEGVGHLWCVKLDGKNDVSPDKVTDAKVFPPKTTKNPKSAAVWTFGGLAPKEEAEATGRDYRFGRTMSTCAIHDGLLYIADLGGMFYCLDAKAGKLLWSHDLEAQVWGSPYWVDGKVFIGNDNGDVYIFAHGNTKKLLPKVRLQGGAIRSNPTVVDGVLYIMASSRLYAIEKK